MKRGRGILTMGHLISVRWEEGRTSSCRRMQWKRVNLQTVTCYATEVRKSCPNRHTRVIAISPISCLGIDKGAGLVNSGGDDNVTPRLGACMSTKKWLAEQTSNNITSAPANDCCS